MWTLSSCIGRHEEHECREEGEDDGGPDEHVDVVHARATHVNRVHNGPGTAATSCSQTPAVTIHRL